jgi:hypothetical protein
VASRGVDDGGASGAPAVVLLLSAPAPVTSFSCFISGGSTHILLHWKFRPLPDLGRVLRVAGTEAVAEEAAAGVRVREHLRRPARRLE